MKGEKRKLIFVYALIFVVIFLIIALTFIVLDSLPEKVEEGSTANESSRLDVSVYPNVSNECTFNVTYSEYNALTLAGCKGGYTRYNLTDVLLNGTSVNVSIVYSDKNQPKTGMFVNDKKIINGVDNVVNIKFGIFENMLFIHDTTDNEQNALAIDSTGKKVYDLSSKLKEEKVSDPLLTTVKTLSSKTVGNFNFGANVFTFTGVVTDDAGNVTTGSSYMVTFSGNTFSKVTKTA